MVEATGRGCPVDTSVLSTEAPTEAAAETLNLRHPVLGAGTKKQQPFGYCLSYGRGDRT